MGFMYILKCSDGSYYVGSTRNLERRMGEHSTGQGAAYTRTRMPVELVFVAEFEDVREAYAFEKRVQGWSRAKREALIAGDFNAISRLGRKKFREAPGHR